jgi:hypothetical protein
MSVTHFAANSVLRCGTCEDYQYGSEGEFTSLDAFPHGWFLDVDDAIYVNDCRYFDLERNGFDVVKLFLCPMCDEYTDNLAILGEVWRCDGCNEFYSDPDVALGCCGSTELVESSMELKVKEESEIPELPPELVVTAETQEKLKREEALASLGEKITSVAAQASNLATALNGVMANQIRVTRERIPASWNLPNSMAIRPGDKVEIQFIPGGASMPFIVSEDGKLTRAPRQ